MKDLDEISSRELLERLQIREYDILGHCDDSEVIVEAEIRGYTVINTPSNLSIVLEQSLKNVLKVFEKGDISMINKIEELINKN